jgi:8-oxo-dGTP pyrophosphatase MutT (NUDIX family)
VKVYLHEIILHFHKVAISELTSYDTTVEKNTKIDYNSLKGNVLIILDNFPKLDEIIDFLLKNKPDKLSSITFDWDEKKVLKKYLKTKFTYIKAAGGLVLKDGNFLFIYRLKKWDLPKGKLEKGEEIQECALREVEEECNIKVSAGPKIGNTWHCYNTKNGWCIKRSTWYKMKCTDDSKMKPQYQEDIEDIAWVSPTNVEKYLKNSYNTISDVFDKAKKKKLI